jgi:hypothetical protein
MIFFGGSNQNRWEFVLHSHLTNAFFWGINSHSMKIRKKLQKVTTK